MMKTQDFKNIPVYHWDLPHTECADIPTAKRWANKIIEELSHVFCKEYCDRGECNIEKGELICDKSKCNIEKWELMGIVDTFSFDNESISSIWCEVQKKLHEAISYLPGLLNSDECPACAVVKAFAYFPELIKYSKCPPVAWCIVKPNPLNPLAEPFPPLVSFPCCILANESEYQDPCEDDIQFKSIREIALVDFNTVDLPTMHPQDTNIMIKDIMLGQKVLKSINEIDSHDQQKKTDISDKPPAKEEFTETSTLTSQNVFRKKGEYWEIVYDGNELGPYKNMDGFHYIVYLMQHKKVKISCLELYYTLHPSEKENSAEIANSMTMKKNFDGKDEEKMNSELEISKGEHFFETIDPQAKKEYRERLNEIAKEREEAIKKNDNMTINSLNDEVKFIKNTLMNSYFDSKKSDVNTEKARKKVSRAIIRCIEKIKDDKIVDYLNDKIDKGYFFCFTPAPSNPIDWNF